MAYCPTQCSPAVDAAIRRAAAWYNLPRWFYYAVLQRESSFDPRSVNDWDGAAHTPWFGAGLTQLTWQCHRGAPYPYDLKEPDNAYQQWVWDMGINLFGPWIDMARVSPLYDPFDPQQNLDRFSTIHAVPWYLYQKRLHRAEAPVTILERVAYNWKHGLFKADYPHDLSYIEAYREYVDEYRPPVEAEDGTWNGLPRLRRAPKPPAKR